VRELGRVVPANGCSARRNSISLLFETEPNPKILEARRRGCVASACVLV
jgi:hypothetical protein